MTLSDTTPSEYKILNGDGTLTAMKSEVIKDTSTLTIKTQSSYGQYEVDPVTSENSPLSNLDAKNPYLVSLLKTNMVINTVWNIWKTSIRKENSPLP